LIHEVWIAETHDNNRIRLSDDAHRIGSSASHSFDNLGRRVRISEVTSHPMLIQGDNPDTPDFVEPYYLSGDGTNKVTSLNPIDGTVISVTEGCNKATSAPFLFRD
jgi:hypothetical protein